MFVKPKPGIKIRHPVTKALIPAEGINVDDHDIFFHRRLRDGDMTVQENQPASAAPAAPAKE